MKDLRKDFDYSSSSFKMSKGHEDRFKNKLDRAFGETSKTDFSIYYKMAAVFVVAVVSTVFVLNSTGLPAKPTDVSTTDVVESSKISLGDISPDLKTIEDYYMTSIKLELATLETTTAHEAMVNSYLDELKTINRAYDDLELDLNEYGVSEEVINAMIENLQLRLELLQDLKKKLNNLNLKQNESNPVYQI